MKKKFQSTEIVAGLLLFLMFTVSMLFVLLFGAKAYKNISLSMDGQYRERTCLSYIGAKARHYDSNGGVYLTDFEGTPALAFDESDGIDTYTTLIYYYDGYVYELYALKDDPLMPSDGMTVIAVDNLEFKELDDGLLEIECGTNGRNAQIIIGTSSGGER